MRRRPRNVLRSLFVATVALVAAGPTAAACGLGAFGPDGERPRTVTTASLGGPLRGMSAITPGGVDRTSIALSATYDVRATLAYDVPSIRVITDIAIRNTSGGPIDRVELNIAPARLGRMRLDQSRVDGAPVRATVTDQTLTVPLGGVLADGARVALRIGYTAWFNTSATGSNWMFARLGGVLAAYRWIPWVSRARPFDRPNHGDPFVTPVSPRVTVRMTTDRVLVFASTGARVASGNGGLTQVFEATHVRDFNFTAAPDYRTARGTAGDTRIIVFVRSGAPSGSGAAILDAAKRAVIRFEELVGPYPYPDLLIGQTGGGYGLESPAHVWIPSSTAASNIRYLVTHEIAHQWFYATVGNDQTSEPWADEAAADFITRYALGMRRSSRCSAGTLDRTIYEYSSACYFETVYIQGGNFLDDIRRRGDVADADFWAGIRDYYATWRFRIGGTRQLLDTIDRHTPVDLAASYGTRFPRSY